MKECCCARSAAPRSCGSNWSTWPTRPPGPTLSCGSCGTRAAPTPAIAGEFAILGFPALISPDVVYLEHMTSNIYVEQEAEVYRYNLAFDRLLALALDPEQSRQMIV